MQWAKCDGTAATNPFVASKYAQNRMLKTRPIFPG